MRSIVVHTYYHLLHAIALTIGDGKPARLYVARSYEDFPDDMLGRIRSTGLFHEVAPINEKGYLHEFREELLTTVDMTDEEIDGIGSTIFDRYLLPYYGALFEKADADDEFIIYNEFQWYFYYIAKYFQNITVAEDGYGVLQAYLTNKQELFAASKFHAPKIRFFGKYYPEPLFKHENVRKVISSVGGEALPGYLADKLEIIDFLDLIKIDFDKYKKTALAIFDLQSMEIPKGGALILGQPVAKIDLGTVTDEYFLHRRMVSDERMTGAHVYFKPHPVQAALDFKCLSREGVTVFNKDFPIELLEYLGATFDKAVTFASSGLDTISSAREKVRIAGDYNNSADKIRENLTAYVAGEKLKVAICVPAVKPSIVTDIAVEHLITSDEEIDIDIRVVTLPKYVKQLSARIDRKYSDHLPKNVTVNAVAVGKPDGASIFNQAIQNDADVDYFIILEDDGPVPKLTHTIVKRLQKERYSLKALEMIISDATRDDTPYTPRKHRKEEFRARITGCLFRRECVFSTGDVSDAREFGKLLSQKKGKVRVSEVVRYDLTSKRRLKALYRKHLKNSRYYDKMWESRS